MTLFHLWLCTSETGGQRSHRLQFPDGNQQCSLLSSCLLSAVILCNVFLSSVILAETGGQRSHRLQFPDGNQQCSLLSSCLLSAVILCNVFLSSVILAETGGQRSHRLQFPDGNQQCSLLSSRLRSLHSVNDIKNIHDTLVPWMFFIMQRVAIVLLRTSCKLSSERILRPPG